MGVYKSESRPHVISRNLLNILVSGAIVTLEALSVIPDSTHPLLRIYSVFLLGAVPLIAIIAHFAPFASVASFFNFLSLACSYMALAPNSFHGPVDAVLACLFFPRARYFLQPLEAQVPVLPPLALSVMLAADVGLFYNLSKSPKN